MNPFDIRVSCIKIARSEVLFEQYRMAIKREKYDIEVKNDDAIKRNGIFFDFMKRTLNCLDGIYLCERYILIDPFLKCDFIILSNN